MKNMKMFLSLIVLFVSPLLFSASGDSVATDPPVTIEVGESEIIVQLQSTSDMSSYDLGFSATPVTQWSTKATPIAASMSLKPVLDPAKGTFHASLDEENGQVLYVYWRLYSLKTVKLNLKIGGPMKNSLVKTDTLDWYVDWNPVSKDNPKLTSKKAANIVTVHTCPALLTLQGVAGCEQIHVYTDELLDKSTAGTYSASLILTVVVS